MEKLRSNAPSPSSRSAAPASKAVSNFGDYQTEIYFAGMRGERQRLPTDFKLLEERATQTLPRDLVDYVQGGCGDGRMQELNVSSFERWGLLPRMLVATSRRDL